MGREREMPEKFEREGATGMAGLREDLQCLTCQPSCKSMTVLHINYISGLSVYDLIADVTLKRLN